MDRHLARMENQKYVVEVLVRVPADYLATIHSNPHIGSAKLEMGKVLCDSS